MPSLFPHPFSLHHDHLVYFGVFTLLVLALGAISTVLRVFFQKTPYSLLIICLWSLLLTLCFCGDFLLMSARQFAPTLICFALASFALSYWRLKRDTDFISFSKSYLANNSTAELISTICLWAVGLFILLIPLAFGFPENTLITSHFISNDSVVHSIMGGGISYMKSRHIDPFYYSAAPRGIHSFTFYFHSLFKQIEISRIILATTIAAYSLTVLSADILLRSLGVSRLIRFFGSLLPVCAFLPMSTVYTIFLGQSSAAPSTFAAIALAFSIRKFGTLQQGIVLFAATTLGAITAYGLFSGSLIGFAVVLSFFFGVKGNPTSAYIKTQLNDFLNTVKSPLNVAIGLLFLLLAYPSISFALYVLGVQGTGTVASDLSAAVGNLPEGYLSPLHLSGLWPPGVGYREQLVRYWSAFGSALLFLILLQFFFITRVSAQGIGFLLTLAIPCLATTILIKSPYIHFKYFSYLVVAFLIVSAAGLDVVREAVGKNLSETRKLLVSILFSLSLVGFEAACVLYPLPTATIIPSLVEGHFSTFEMVWKLVEGKRTMVLTKEDWLQYGAQADDYVPLIIYIPQRFNSEPLDAVVLDRAWKTDSMEYLKQFPKLLNLVQDQKCMTVVGDRFEIYLPNC